MLFFLRFISVGILILFSLITAEKSEVKLEKHSKPSDFKLKLAKEHSLEFKATEKENSSYEKVEETTTIDDLGITVPADIGTNYTVEFSHHVYYNSTFYIDPEKGREYWLELDSSHSNVITHDMLSNSHRQATTVELTFGFPFYGNVLSNITIATGGFLYMGDYLHNWIAATQYVAPLMANFDTSQSTSSQIKYLDNGTAFTVEWDNVFVEQQIDEGAFTFQVTLLKSGDIIFAYKNVPYPVYNITDERHPVKIGISDAYILERSLFFVKRKTIYEYHRINFLRRNIANGTAIYFTALPTCGTFTTCTTCLSADTSLECNWCNAVQRCSDGIDRNRQNWVINNCYNNPVASCISPAAPTTTDHGHIVPRKGAETQHIDGDSTTFGSTFEYKSSSDYNVNNKENTIHPSQGAALYSQDSNSSGGGMSVGAIITLVVFAAALLCTAMWAGYAYKNPQSSSGQFLIKYRPSQWALKKEGNTMAASSRHF